MNNIIKTLILFLSLTAFSMAGVAQRNILKPADVSVGAGKEAELRIMLENSSDVVALQFTMILPDGLTADTGRAYLSERVQGHSSETRMLDGRRLMCMVFSAENAPLRGRDGVIVTIPVKAAAGLADGTTLPLSMSDVVITARDGSDLTTGVGEASVTIASRPDFEVSDVKCRETEIVPGGKTGIGWKVANTGGMATESGWTEHVFLVSADGSERLVGTVRNNETIPPGGIMVRDVEIEFPRDLGVDGECHIAVRLTPFAGSGEPESLRGNNSCLSASAVTVARKLWLSPESSAVDEADGETLRIVLTRSGDSSSDERFDLSFDEDSRVSLAGGEPVIKAGESQTVIPVKITPNGRLDASDVRKLTMTVSGNGYSHAYSSLFITDDTLPAIYVETDKDSAAEGENLVLKVETERVQSEDMTVTLDSDRLSDFDMPGSVVIPAGKTEVSVSLTVNENSDMDGDRTAEIRAGAPRHVSGRTYLTIQDNDLPHIALALTSKEVSEKAGGASVMAKVSVSEALDKELVVRLSDDSRGGLAFGERDLVIPAGVKETMTFFGPVDNSVVDGDRVYTVTAAILLPSCGCTASEDSKAGHVSSAISVIDDDGPALSLYSARSSLAEGETLDIKVARNTAVDNALTVSLAASRNDVSVPAEIVIPAGSRQAAFALTIPENSSTGDSYQFDITAVADGHSKGILPLSVTDNSLPDARLADFSAEKTTGLLPGETVNLSVTVENAGMIAVPALTPVHFIVTGGNGGTVKAYLSAELKPGESVTISKPLRMPERIADISVRAVVNPDKSVEELNHFNNSYSDVELHMSSPLSVAAIAADKDIYSGGETVRFSGTVGTGSGKSTVEVYVINDGYREAFEVETASDGKFSADYTPLKGQDGRFSYGVCWPGEDLRKAMGGFDIYGLRRSLPGGSTYSRIETRTGDPETISMTLRNPSSLPLTGLSARLEDQPDNVEVQIVCPESLAAGQAAEVTVRLTGIEPSPGKGWQKMTLSISTDQGAESRTSVYYHCKSQRGVLETDVTAINTTMSIHKGKDYTVRLSNSGKGETGRIRLSLPEWIRPSVAAELPSLSPGESVSVPLKFIPDDRMILNFPVKSSIVFSCDNGSFARINVEVEPVSEEKGTLTLDACDNYTYYTPEAPHLKDAVVTIKHPATGAVLAEGKTGADGLFSADLPEGQYDVSVTAENHESYRRSLSVDPGKERSVTVNLKYLEVEMDMEIERYEQTDLYFVKNTGVFETRVPEPKVVISGPDRIDGENMAYGESVIVNFILTNVGQIAALNTHLVLPATDKDWQWEFLEEQVPVTLAPKQSRGVAVRITRLGASASKKGMAKAPALFEACLASIMANYEFWCGEDMKKNASRFRMAFKLCMMADIMNNLASVIGGGGAGGGTTGPVEPPRPPRPGDPEPPSDPGEEIGDGPFDPTTDFPDRPLPERPLWCEPCMNDLAEKALNAVITRAAGDFGDVYGVVNAWSDMNINRVRTGSIDPEDVADFAGAVMDAGESALDQLHGEGGVNDMILSEDELDLIYEFITSECLEQARRNSYRKRPEGGTDPDTPGDGGSGSGDGPSSDPGEGDNTSDTDENNEEKQVVEDAQKETEDLDDAQDETYGENKEIWRKTDSRQLHALLNQIAKSEPGQALDVESLRPFKPEGVSFEVFTRFIERMSNTITDADSPNKIDLDALKERIERIDSLEQAAVAKGFASVNDRLKAVLSDLEQELYDMSSTSVCANVTMAFENKVYITREAFRGKLHVYNGHAENSVDDAHFSVYVNDTDGVTAGEDRFEIALESIEGFAGERQLGGTWSLEAGKHGYATVTFLPSRLAAPTAPVEYDFGGTMTYVDPFSGLRTTRQLTETRMTVNPCPLIDLDYFIQRDVIADDPLTEEVEDAVPAEFSLLMRNKGYGDAGKVSIVARKPKIVDNEKGLDVGFKLKEAYLNGKESGIALDDGTATDIGGLKAGESAVIQWMIEGSRLGHFTDYDVSAIRVSGNDNPAFSLLDKVSTHELIRSVDTGNGEGRYGIGFLVNDVADREDLPDMLYHADGMMSAVSRASAEVEHKGDDVCIMTVKSSVPGWFYGYVADPNYGLSRLKSVTRLDGNGKECSLRNFWTTDRTLRDGKDPIYENRIHFTDSLASSGEVSYRLVFEPRPGLVLDVVAVDGIPEEGAVATVPVDRVRIKFNKKIDPSSFSTEDLALEVEGRDIGLDGAVITTDDDKTFSLDMSAISISIPDGYHLLTVRTSGITDCEGFTGSAGRSFGWVSYRKGGVVISTLSEPENAGRIYADGVLSSGKVTADYGQEVAFRAECADGYAFSGWRLGKDQAGSTAEISIKAESAASLAAVFTPRLFNVEIVVNAEEGHVSGGASCMLPFGETLALTAVPDSDYDFAGWTVNGKYAGRGRLEITVSGDMSIVPVFNKVRDSRSLILGSGWNWISHPFVTDLDLSGRGLKFHDDGNSGIVSPGASCKVRSDAPINISFRSVPFSDPVSVISLEKGWNMVGFQGLSPVSLEDGVVSASAGDVFAGQYAFAIYDGSRWRGSLDALEPMRGYMYHASGSGELRIQLSSESQEVDMPNLKACNPGLYPEAMQITSSLVYGDGCRNDGTLNVYAMKGNECRGEGFFDGDRLYITVYGDGKSEKIHFIVEDPESGTSSLAEETLEFSQSPVGNVEVPFTLTCGRESGVADGVVGDRGMTIVTPDGIVISRNADLDTVRSLAPGIYIIDGRKYVVR